MKLPKQAKPVMRNGSTVRIEAGVEPSLACAICGLMSGTAKDICEKVCGFLPF